jgi:hypothetical protein
MGSACSETFSQADCLNSILLIALLWVPSQFAPGVQPTIHP